MPGWLAGLLLLLAAGAAVAEPERRLLTPGEAEAYRAVGRLNIAGTRFCTATLIEPAVVVTAAHCLFHPRTHARVPVSEMRFVVGVYRGDEVAVRQVVRSVTQPDFAFDGMASYAGVRADLALLELDEAVPAEAAVPFAPGPLEPKGPPLAIVSYARDRPQAPSIEAPCALASSFGGVVALECAVTYGASGAPVLQGAVLVAVVSAMGQVLETQGDVTLTVLAAPEIEALKARLAAAPREQ